MSDKKPLDLDDLAQGQKVDIRLISPESPLELETRLKIQELDARHQRWKDTILLAASVIGVLLFSGFCVYIYVSPASSADDRKWAASIITLIVGGLVGYWSGKNAK
jgi:hypothetical protein